MNRKYSGVSFAEAILAVLLLAFFSVGDARAAHDSGRQCYDCHDMTGANVQVGTSLLSKSVMAESRTNGWTNGRDGVGCTFCHRSVSATASMPDALTGFVAVGPTSRHPVGRNFNTGAAETDNAYLSNDNTNTAGHLDCKDCHDVTLVSYPEHSANWINNVGAAGQTKTTNPFGLKNVTAPKAYDDLCRACHRSGAAFTAFTGKAINTGVATKLVLASHDNAIDNTTNAIKDLDNTILRPQNQYAAKRTCSMCHDAHNSSKDHLYNDGHEKDWLGASEPVIDENVDCTSVCHLRGDAVNNYDLYGHGKATNWNGTPLVRACTACHDVSKPHNPSSPDYETKYRFPALDNSWKTPSAYGKPVKSVCAQCHGTMDVHTTAKGDVGCLDCHDQHAKNSDNNVMMIRSTNRVAGTAVGVASGVGSTVGSEPVYFRKSVKYPSGPNYDYFTNTSYQSDTSAGFCDQRACHGAGSTTGTPYIPMATYLSSGKHTGGNQSVNSNCDSCHKHGDSSGSWRAVSSCTSCHGQPPPPADNTAGTVYPRTESLSPHQLHAAPASGAGYGFNCRTCHSYYTDSAYHNQVGAKSFQSVFFDNAYKRGVSAYDNASFTCTNITCHSDGRGNAPRIAPTWFTGGGGQVTLTCVDCHRGSSVSGFPIATGAHTKHLNSGYGCSTCHVNTVADDNVTLNASTGKANHVNFIRNVSIKAAYDNDATSTNNWDNAAGTCSGVKCHGGNAVNWTADIGKVSCANCHVVASAETDDFGTGTPASMFNNNVTASIDNTEWMYSGHGRDTGTFDCTTNVAPNLVGSSTGKNKCKFCHDDTVAHGVTANPFRLANNNWNGKGWNGNCFICHATSAPGYQPPQDNASLTYALKVGTLTSGHSVDNNHFNYGTTSNARHSTTYNGGQFCWDCHDPHGDRSNSATGNIVMIGKKVNRATDNTGGIDLGIPVGGTLGADRVSPKFERRTNGIDFASTDNVAPFDGICEVCHLAASGVTHFYTAASNNHSSSNCIGCHSHDTGFKGSGGSNQEQFFDNSVRVDNAANYKDISGHRIFSTTTLASRTFNTETECYSCHGVSGTNRYSNECLKCHWENRSGAGAHPSGTFEWAVPNGATLPSSQFGSSGPASDAFCLQCHTGAGGATFALNGVNPPLVIPAGETWSATTASGHGTTTTKLSAYSNAGPAALSCRACHYSTGAQSGGTARDNKQPGFHASVNHKLVTNLNYAVREYPDPADNTAGFSGAGNINLRSGLMDSYCATACHRNTTNGTTSDDNVIDHTWDLLGGQTRSGAQSHPSNFLVTPGAYYKNATQLYYSNYTSGGFPGSGNVVCVTCHDPHGGGAIKNAAGTSLTGGAKNMLRLSPADNVSTLCKECHK